MVNRRQRSSADIKLGELVEFDIEGIRRVALARCLDLSCLIYS